MPSLFVTEMSEGRDGFGFFVGVRFHRFGTMSTCNKDWSFWQLCLSEGVFLGGAFLTSIQDTLLW